MKATPCNKFVGPGSGRVLRHLGLGITAICSALAATSCAEPVPKYEPPADDDVVSVNAADLGVTPDALLGVGEKKLTHRPSVARFPTGVAVVRVLACMNEEDARRHLRVVKMPQESAVYWGHLWDDLPPIREVATLGTLALDPRGTDYKTLLRESVRYDCDLCIIFARKEDTDADAELVGVLWEATSHTPLAAYRVPVTLTDETRQECEESHRGGHWVSEAEYRAEADLRRLLRDAMWDLVSEDSPSTTTQPSPWREYLPLFPRDYNRLRRLDKVLHGEDKG